MFAAIGICMFTISTNSIIREWLMDSSLSESMRVSPKLLLQGG